jgi:hypothetical protein
MQRYGVTHTLPVPDRAQGHDESRTPAAAVAAYVRIRAAYCRPSSSAGEAVGDAVFDVLRQTSWA